MSLEAMKLAAEFNRYFTSANGVDVRAKVSVTRDEWRVLFTAILAKQPATPEPVAWIRRHPNGSLSNEMLTHVQVEQVRRDSGAWVPLYTHPAPSDDVVLDAARYRWLRDERIGNCPESINLSHGRKPGLDAAIDAAMIAAKDSK